VIEIEEDERGEPQCVVKNPRKDTVSREVLRHPEFQDLVQLARIRDHFICERRSLRILTAVADSFPDNVESVGQYKPEELVPEAIKILLNKVKEVEEGLDKLFASDADAA
jgi:DNA-directed RNA polymerase I and III subunit RPAC1